MNKKLEVNNLQISFRTQNGSVKAVRDISFDLNEGETLAIVGESGSGKSVTSKAIIGILAPNASVDGGEIIYDGQDLLKISEDDFHKIRGNKISMIFQDPMSSLNPIMRVGRQLTEAMIYNAKSTAKSSRKAFNKKLAHLNENLNMVFTTEVEIEENNLMCKTFDNFCIESTQIELAYNNAMSNILGLITIIDDYLFLIDKKQPFNVHKGLKNIKKQFNGIYNEFLASKEKIEEFTSKIEYMIESYTGNDDYKEIVKLFDDIKEYLNKVLNYTKPNFFTLGYYRYKNKNGDTSKYSIEELNKMTRKYIDDDFMLHFLEKTAKALEYSNNRALELKKVAYEKAQNFLTLVSGDISNKKEIFAADVDLYQSVYAAIDKLELVKDSAQYSFRDASKSILNRYYDALITNPKNQKKYEAQLAKYNKLVEAGKKPSWKVTPPMLVDLKLTQDNLINLVKRLIESLDRDFTKAKKNYDEAAVTLVDEFKAEAAKVVYRVTKKMAKAKAIKLLEEVGISEPAMRYKQYPFEFSGGMRQRIVIAIALASNPDVLICDEPTTALDVTIQSQILELINKLKVERKLSIIFITHDLGVVANMADRIAVMYAGKIVEYGTADDIFYDPRHPYTWALLSSMPDLDTKEKLEAIPGTPPNMIYPPKGDAFAERNKYALDIDFEIEPPLFEISSTHYAATWLLHPNAPKVNPPKIITDRIERMKGAHHE